MKKPGLKLKRGSQRIPHQNAKMRWSPKLKQDAMEKKASQLSFNTNKQKTSHLNYYIKYMERSRSISEGKRGADYYRMFHRAKYSLYSWPLQKCVLWMLHPWSRGRMKLSCQHVHLSELWKIS